YVFFNFCKGSTSFVFRRTSFCYSIYFIVSHIMNFLSQIFIFSFWLILTSFFLTKCFGYFYLGSTLYFYSFVCKLDSFSHFFFRNFIHFTLNHHDRIG